MSGTGAILTRFHSAKCSLPLLAAIIMFAVLIVLTQMDEVEKDVVKEKNKHKPCKFFCVALVLARHCSCK